MNAREYTTTEAQHELARRGCPGRAYSSFYTRITSAGIGHRRGGRWYFTADDIDALTERIGVHSADEYSIDTAIVEIRARIGHVVTQGALYKLRSVHHIGRRVGGVASFSEQDIAAICALYTRAGRTGTLHGGPRIPAPAPNAGPEKHLPTIAPRPRTPAPAPDASYTTPELRAEIYRRTGRHVRSTWLGNSFAPSGGLHWTGGDLLHICAHLDDHPGWRRPQIAPTAAPAVGHSVTCKVAG